jgi:hypothetical protein
MHQKRIRNRPKVASAPRTQHFYMDNIFRTVVGDGEGSPHRAKVENSPKSRLPALAQCCAVDRFRSAPAQTRPDLTDFSHIITAAIVHEITSVTPNWHSARRLRSRRPSFFIISSDPHLMLPPTTQHFLELFYLERGVYSPRTAYRVTLERRRQVCAVHEQVKNEK